MTDVVVSLNPPYQVRLRSTFAEVWSHLRRDEGDRPWMVVVDRNVARRIPTWNRSLPAAARRSVVEIAGGESAKTLARVGTLHQAALDLGLDRGGLVVAVGGGSVGDVTGLFAATYMRGVDWCPVATTALAMADAALGGKTAVNLGGVKNLVGAFHQPRAVYGVVDALATLSTRQERSGLAEVVKSAMIADARMFHRLERDAASLVGGDRAAWKDALTAACAVKAAVVSRDPLERGRRAILNFGHTVGHGLEVLVRPRLLHGEAVALGMIAATLISERSRIASDGTGQRLVGLLEDLGLRTRWPDVDDEELLAVMRHDKKSRSGRLQMVLPTRVGAVRYGQTVGTRQLRSALRRLRG